MTSTTSAAGRAPGRAATVLRQPGFRWWFIAQILSTSGSMVQTIGQSWLVYQLTGRALELALLVAVTWLPVLFGAAWAGGLADRLGARRVLVATQLLFTIVCAVQAVLVAVGVMTVGLVLVFGAVTGAISALDLPARQVYVMEIVGRGGLASAIGLNEVVFNGSRVLGPAIGGILLATIGVPACFAVNALSFVPVLVVLARFAPPELHRERPTPSSYVDGWREVRHKPAVWSCLLVAVGAAMLFNLGVAVPLLASRVYHLGGGGYGALMAAFGIGALPGALVAASGVAAPTGPMVRRLTLATGVAVLATALAPTVVLAAVGIAACGFLSIWLIAVANTLVQLAAAPRVRGRVMGIWTMALPGTIPFTGLVTAVVAQRGSPRLGFGAAGIVLVSVAAVTWLALRPRPAAAATAATATTAANATAADVAPALTDAVDG